MIITTEQLKQMDGAADRLVIDASPRTCVQLRELTAAAAASNAPITVDMMSGLMAVQMGACAPLAPRLITIDLAS